MCDGSDLNICSGTPQNLKPYRVSTPPHAPLSYTLKKKKVL